MNQEPKDHNVPITGNTTEEGQLVHEAVIAARFIAAIAAVKASMPTPLSMH